VPLGEEILLDEGVKEGYPLRNRNFTTVGSSSVRRVADRHRLALIITSTADELSGGTNINDVE